MADAPSLPAGESKLRVPLLLVHTCFGWVADAVGR